MVKFTTIIVTFGIMAFGFILYGELQDWITKRRKKKRKSAYKGFKEPILSWRKI